MHIAVFNQNIDIIRMLLNYPDIDVNSIYIFIFSIYVADMIYDYKLLIPFKKKYLIIFKWTIINGILLLVLIKFKKEFF